MKLFVSDEPFFVYPLELPDGSTLPQVTRVEMRLRVGITDPGAESPPPTSSAREFVIDPAADLVTIYLSDLDASGLGLDPLVGMEQPVVLWDGNQSNACLQAVSLWLFSNLPGLGDQPYRIDLLDGTLVMTDPEPELAHLVRPLFGMNAILDGRLQIHMDGLTRKFSLWIPD